jgi:hypothetical protein
MLKKQVYRAELFLGSLIVLKISNISLKVQALY